jgi:hypothetical protein
MAPSAITATETGIHGTTAMPTVFLTLALMRCTNTRGVVMGMAESR